MQTGQHNEEDTSPGVPLGGSAAEHGPSAPANQANSRAHPIESSHLRFRKWLLVSVGVAAAAVVTAGALAYATERSRLQHAAEEELVNIADLKADQMESWLHERLGDAGVLMVRPTVDSAVIRYLHDPTQSDRETLLTQFKVLRQWYGYSDVVLVNANGVERISLSGSGALLHDSEFHATQAAFKSKGPAMIDLHDQATPHFGVVAPFFSAAGEPVGAIVLRVDAADYLYPLIQSWPTPSETAETLLVRQDGDDALFLNDLRFRENAALALRIPLTRANLPAAMAIEGATGLVEGNDYRGVPVVAVLTPIPETGWYMIAKVDREEVFAVWRVQSTLIGALTFGMVLVAGVFAAYIWQRRSRAEVAALNVALERRVEERTAELEDSNRELEAFAYSVSHDLRSPLRAIDGFSRIVEEEYGEKLDAEGNRLLDVIRRNAQQMDHLIADLLEMSRVGRTQMSISRVDMERLAHTIYNEVATHDVRDSFTFIVRPMPAAFGDATLLRLVLLNLISNAVKFTMPSDTRRIEVGGYFNGVSDVYYVKDTGTGFDSRHKEKLFKVFERLHTTGEFEGTGIGLAIVARAVNRHGGRVWAEGEVGKGATFYFALPAKGG